MSHQTAQIQLSRPEGLRVVEKTTQQIHIEWSRSHERQQIHYRLQFTEAETEQWRDVYEGPQPHARVSSLSHGLDNFVSDFLKLSTVE